MKIRIFAVLFAFFCFIPAAHALDLSLITYQPDWQVGDKATYVTDIESTLDAPAHPFAPLFKNQPDRSQITTIHTVIGRDDSSTEFQVRIQHLYLPESLLSKLLPDWRQEFEKRMGYPFTKVEEFLYQNAIFSYRIDSTGKIIEITHLEDWIDFYNESTKLSNGKLQPIPPEKREEKLQELQKYANEQLLPHLVQHLDIFPHSPEFLGKNFSGGINQPITQTSTTPTLPNVTTKPLSFTYSGAQDVVLNGENVQIVKSFRFTEQDIHKFGDQALKNLDFSFYSKNDEKELRSLWKEWKKNQPLSLTARAEVGIQFRPGDKFAKEFTYLGSYSGELYPNRIPRRHTVADEPVPFSIRTSIVTRLISEEKGGQP
jgi:hypothetical protein